MNESLFHFDPIVLGTLIAGLIGGWYTLKGNTQWHTDWIKKHSYEDDQRHQQNLEVLAKLTESNAKLTVLAEQHNYRLERIEMTLDKRL